MKFTCIVEINAPINQVAELLEDKNHFKDWQKGFVRYEPLSGIPGEPGAKSKIVINSGKQLMELTETIIARNFPAETSLLYEHEHMDNTVHNSFTALGANQTRLISDIEYIKFKGIMPKLMSALMPGFFKKQTQNWLDNFKVFVEKTVGRKQ